MKLIWATRGRSWGFRFLLNGGLVDPLATYEEAFARASGERTFLKHARSVTALRFPDPLGRCDESGRVIPHDVVILELSEPRVGSVEAGRELVWPLMEAAFAEVWDRPRAPRPDSVRLAGPGD